MTHLRGASKFYFYLCRCGSREKGKRFPPVSHLFIDIPLSVNTRGKFVATWGPTLRNMTYAVNVGVVVLGCIINLRAIEHY